jgi:hypothetical protein
LHKKLGKIGAKFVQYYHLTFPSLRGIIYMSRGDARWHWVPHNAKGSTPYTDEYERPSKNFQKVFENPLTKPQKCGIIYV